MISSRRKKRKRTGSVEDPHLWLADIVVKLLPKQEIKYDHLNNPIWEKNTLEGVVKYTGYEEIINETYLTGFYDENIVQSEEGQCWLERAGLSNNPYSIFNERLQQKRKHYMQNKQRSSTSRTAGINGQSIMTANGVTAATNGNALPSPPPSDAVNAATAIKPAAAKDNEAVISAQNGEATPTNNQEGSNANQAATTNGQSATMTNCPVPTIAKSLSKKPPLENIRGVVATDPVSSKNIPTSHPRSNAAAAAATVTETAAANHNQAAFQVNNQTRNSACQAEGIDRQPTITSCDDMPMINAKTLSLHPPNNAAAAAAAATAVDTAAAEDNQAVTGASKGAVFQMQSQERSNTSQALGNLAPPATSMESVVNYNQVAPILSKESTGVL